MATDLEARAREARAVADAAEAERLAANVRARELAVTAAELERQIDERERAHIYAEMGKPTEGAIVP